MIIIIEYNNSIYYLIFLKRCFRVNQSLLAKQKIYIMHTTGEIHKIFTKVEGNEGCLNDVIVFKANRENFVPKCNLIYFGGDIQVRNASYFVRFYENRILK